MKEQYQRFCEEYLSNGFKAREAAIAAGSKETSAALNACRWMKHKEVIDYIRMRTTQLREKCDITREWKMQKLKLCIESSIIKVNDVETAIDPKTIISAVGELNKMQGDYAPEKHEHDISENLDELLQQYRRAF